MKQLYLLLITLLVSLSAYAEKSGTCGDNLQWKLTDEGVLTITGTGKMKNYSGSSRPWSAYKNVIKQVIIDDGVTTIGDGAFANTSLTSITIPNSVTTIGSSAFYDCSSLTSVTIGNGVRTIEGGAFSSCSSLASITIPNSVRTIGGLAFSYCSSLASITIPNSVTRIWHSAFYGCKNIKQITSEAVTPPGCSRYTFKGCNTRECKLIVPQNSIDAYKKANGWNKFFLIEGTTTGI